MPRIQFPSMAAWRWLWIALVAGLLLPAAQAQAQTQAQPKPQAQDRCGGTTLPLEFAPPGHAPHVRLEADGRNGAFLLDYGATRSSLSADHFPAAIAGKSVSFSLPTFAQGTFSLMRYPTGRAPAGGQIGIVGTDFLSLLTADFSFTEGTVQLSAAACDPERLRRRGLVPVSQEGFFGRDLSRIPPSRPVVPILYVRLAGFATWAQVDTGYDDTSTYPSIDINDALFERLQARGAPLQRARDVTMTTCAGRETRETYTLEAATLETEAGAAIRRIEKVLLLRKPRNACGGIAGLTTPAAQLAASFLYQAGDVVFDPASERIWLRKD